MEENIVNESNFWLYSAMLKGARQILLRLIQLGVISNNIPRIKVKEKISIGKADKLWKNAIISQCLTDKLFLSKIMSGEEFFTFYEISTINNKEYRTLRFEFKN